MSILKVAAMMIGLSALFHLIAPLVSGFSSESLQLMPFSAIFGLLAWFVSKNKRWAAWLAFLLTLFFGIAGMSGFLTPATIPAWVSLGIWLTDWVAAACLFIILWNDHRRAQAG